MHLELPVRKRKEKSRRSTGDDPCIRITCHAIGYTVVMGWILRYAVGTFTGATLSPENVDEFGAAFGKMASAFGNNIWQILALVACMLILMLGVGSGIEKANKIMMPDILRIVRDSGNLCRIPAGSK